MGVRIQQIKYYIKIKPYFHAACYADVIVKVVNKNWARVRVVDQLIYFFNSILLDRFPIAAGWKKLMFVDGMNAY